MCRLIALSIKCQEKFGKSSLQFQRAQGNVFKLLVLSGEHFTNKIR